MKFNFADHKVVDSIDKIPQDFRGLYVEDEGKFKLNTEDEKVAAAVSAITKLNESLVAERAAHEATKKNVKSVDLSALADYGETPDEIVEAFKTKLAEAGKGKTVDKDVIAQHVKNAQDAMAKEHQRELDTHAKRNEALQKRLYEELVTNKANSALAEAGTIDADLARPHLVNRVKVSETDGEFSVNVVDEQGEVRYSGTTGKPMTIAERVAEMKGEEKYAPLFKSDKPSGGGKTPTSPTRTTPGQATGDMSATDKIKVGLDKGQATRVANK